MQKTIIIPGVFDRFALHHKQVFKQAHKISAQYDNMPILIYLAADTSIYLQTKKFSFLIQNYETRFGQLKEVLPDIEIVEWTNGVYQIAANLRGAIIIGSKYFQSMVDGINMMRSYFSAPPFTFIIVPTLRDEEGDRYDCSSARHKAICDAGAADSDEEGSETVSEISLPDFNLDLDEG